MDWAQANAALLWWLFAASLAMAVLTPLLVGWIIVRLPADYFEPERRERPASWRRQGLMRPLVFVAKNLAGIVLAIAGLVMLVTPGQGLLTLAVALMLLDFPGKYRVERWLVTRPAVWKGINWLRQRAGREPLRRPR